MMAFDKQWLKIAIVIKECSSTRGGAERYSMALISELSRLGHEVHIFTHKCDSELPKEVTIHSVPIIKLGSGVKILSFAHYSRNMLLQGDFDVVYGLTQIYPQDLYRLGGGIHLHWLNLRYPNPIRRRLACLTPGELAALYIEHQIFKPANYKIIVANSKLTAGHARQYYKVPEDRIRVIYNGVDLNKFNPRLKDIYRESVRIKHGLGNEMVILFVSNNWSRKGLSTLIKGASSLLRQRKATIIVVGKGKQGRYLHQIRQLGIDGRVIFVPPYGNIEEYYGGADVFVLPTMYDPFANTCLEAMASGLPVITTSENGASEIIKEGENGFVLHNPFDHEKLEYFLNLLTNKELRDALGKEAYRSAQQLTPGLNSSQTIEAFHASLEIGPPISRLRDTRRF